LLEGFKPVKEAYDNVDSENMTDEQLNAILNSVEILREKIIA